MNKYIYKVRFVTLKFLYITIRTKIKHKHELIFGEQQFNYNFNNSSIIISTTVQL